MLTPESKRLSHRNELPNSHNIKNGSPMHQILENRDKSEPPKEYQNLQIEKTKMQQKRNSKGRLLGSKSPHSRIPSINAAIKPNNGNSYTQYNKMRDASPLTIKPKIGGLKNATLEHEKQKKPNGSETISSVKAKQTPTKPIQKKRKGKGMPPIPKKPVATNAILLQQSLGGTQFNSFGVQELEKDTEKSNEVEIEEIIETDDRQSTISRKDMDCIQNACEDAQSQNDEENKGKDNKWTVTKGIPVGLQADNSQENMESGEVQAEEENSEEEKVELIGAKNLSVIDCPNLDNFRPFTPPFAKLQSSPAKIKEKGAALQEENKVMPIEQKIDADLDMKNINEVYGEDEEKIDMVYDPVLKCYYDPNTNTYFQLKAQP